MTLARPASLTWPELARRTVKESIDDDVLGLAAQLAYYFFLALFPAILFLLAVASFFPLATLADDIGRVLGPLVSPEILDLIQDQMRRLADAEDGGLLTFGVLGALWSGSAALVSIVGALNRAYDIDEGRSWWQVRLVALGLTIALAVLVLCAFSLVLAGPAAARYLRDTAGLGTAFEWTWLILQWPVAFALVSIGIGLVYYFAPDADQDWEWVTPGAVLATLLWLVGSLAFKLYVARFTDYNGSYGTVGGVIVLLLWFYLTGIAVLVGAEMNAEIEHASPYGKAPGEKTATGRRALGRRAARAFEERQKAGAFKAGGPFGTVLFDVDGTLVDSNRAHAHAWAQALREHGVNVGAAEIRPLIGMGGDKLLAAVAHVDEDSAAGKAITGRKKEIFDTLLPGLQPTPGSRSLVAWLREQKIDLVIATSAGDREMNALLQRAGVDDLIPQRASKDDASQSKPDPDIVRAALDRSAARPETTLMIGDTPYDIEAAAGAGVAAIALRCGGHWSDDDLGDARAIFDDPAALLAHWQDVKSNRGVHS